MAHESEGQKSGASEFTPILPDTEMELSHDEDSLQHALGQTSVEDKEADRLSDTPKTRYIAEAMNRSYKIAHEGGLSQEESQEVMNLVAMLAQHSFETKVDLFSPENTDARAKLAGQISPEQDQVIRQLQRALETDALTGVANLRSLNKALPKAEADNETAVIVFDANNFKHINDTFGHEVGDEFIIAVSSAITEAAGKYAARVFRRGGDEFVLLVPNESAENILQKAEQNYDDEVAKLREQLAKRNFPPETLNFYTSLSGSIGTRESNKFKDADNALQEMKNARKLRDKQRLGRD